MFPTGVGMNRVRPANCSCPAEWYVPHGRGDEPPTRISDNGYWWAYVPHGRGDEPDTAHEAKQAMV